MPSSTDTPTPPNAEQLRAHAGDAARLLKALANEKRLMILCMLVGADRSVGELNAQHAQVVQGQDAHHQRTIPTAQGLGVELQGCRRAAGQSRLRLGNAGQAGPLQPVAAEFNPQNAVRAAMNGELGRG